MLHNGSPLALMIHGGGFCLGAPEGEEQTCRNMVLGFGATCVAIVYRLSPQYPFSLCIQRLLRRSGLVRKNATSWNTDPAKGFIVGGLKRRSPTSPAFRHTELAMKASRHL